MSKGKKKSSINGGLPFQRVPGDRRYHAIYDSFIDSKAFEQLPGNSIKVLLAMYRLVKGDHYQFIATYEQIKKMTGLSYQTIKSSIDNLVSAGVIEIKKPGGLFHQVSVYSFSDSWEKSYKQLD